MLAAKRDTIWHEFKSGRHSWRVQSDERGRFDEIAVVVGKPTKAGRAESGLILHAEMLNDRECFVDVAGLQLWVYIDGRGIARISNIEDTRIEFWTTHKPLAKKSDRPKAKKRAKRRSK